MCAGAGYVFSPSKPHSGTLCNENNIDDENMDIAGAPPHEADENVEPQAQTEQITLNNAANRRVRRAEVVSGDAKYQCQDCERTFSAHSGL